MSKRKNIKIRGIEENNLTVYNQWGARTYNQGLVAGRLEIIKKTEEFIGHVMSEIGNLYSYSQEVEIIAGRIDECLLFNIKTGNRLLMVERLKQLSERLAAAGTAYKNALALFKISDTSEESALALGYISVIQDGITGILAGEKDAREVKDDIEKLLKVDLNSIILEKIDNMPDRGRKQGISEWRQWLRRRWTEAEKEHPESTAAEIKQIILDGYYNAETKQYDLDDLASHVKTAINNMQKTKRDAAKYRDDLLK